MHEASDTECTNTKDYLEPATSNAKILVIRQEVQPRVEILCMLTELAKGPSSKPFPASGAVIVVFLDRLDNINHLFPAVRAIYIKPPPTVAIAILTSTVCLVRIALDNLAELIYLVDTIIEGSEPGKTGALYCLTLHQVLAGCPQDRFGLMAVAGSCWKAATGVGGYVL